MSKHGLPAIQTWVPAGMFEILNLPQQLQYIVYHSGSCARQSTSHDSDLYFEGVKTIQYRQGVQPALIDLSLRGIHLEVEIQP